MLVNVKRPFLIWKSLNNQTKVYNSGSLIVRLHHTLHKIHHKSHIIHYTKHITHSTNHIIVDKFLTIPIDTCDPGCLP